MFNIMAMLMIVGTMIAFSTGSTVFDSIDYNQPVKLMGHNRLVISAFNQSFSFQLLEDESLLLSDISIDGSPTTINRYSYMVTGFEERWPEMSSIKGVVIGSSFEGAFNIGPDNFIVESIFNDSTWLSSVKRTTKSEIQQSLQRKRRSAGDDRVKTCNLLIHIDHTAYQTMMQLENGSEPNAISRLVVHIGSAVKTVDSIFSETIFQSRDGRLGPFSNLHVKVRTIRIYRTEVEFRSYFKIETDTEYSNPMHSLLKTNTAGYCAAFIFVGRSIPRLLGAAWMNGACGQMNIAIIDFNVQKAITPLVIAHELGHLFGPDDNDADCINRLDDGKKYLMHTDLSQPTSSSFSDCSREAIAKRINAILTGSNANCLLATDGSGSLLTDSGLREYFSPPESDDDRVNYDEAQIICQRYGARLAWITSASDDLILNSASYVENRWIGLKKSGSKYYWFKNATNSRLADEFTAWENDKPEIHNSFKNCVVRQKNGKWNDVSCFGYRAKPLCEKLSNRCGKFPGLENGVIVNGSPFYYDDEAILVCSKGFRLVGSQRVHCSHDAHWMISGECVSECGDPPEIINGSIVDNQQRHVGSFLHFKCNAGLFLIGKAEMMCNNDFKWTLEGQCSTSHIKYFRPYLNSAKRMDMSSAQDLCLNEGGQLARVRSQEDADSIRFMGGAWIGLKRSNDQNEFRWISKDSTEIVNFASWKKGEPNNYDGKENCVLLSSDSTWNDVSCDRKLGFALCERHLPGCKDVIQIENGWLEPNVPSLDKSYNLSCYHGFQMDGSVGAICQRDGSWKIESRCIDDPSIKHKRTTWLAVHEGEGKNLANHAISCPRDSAISQFQLFHNRDNEIAYQFQCVNLAGLSNSRCRKVENNFTANWNGHVQFLDRQNVICDAKAEFLTAFKLEVDGGEWRYHYTCCIAPLDYSKCDKRNTEVTTNGDGQVIFLDRHNINCASDKTAGALKGFRAANGDNNGNIDKIYYRFECCFLL